MISHQQARRNMTSGELIYANSMVADEIALENEKKSVREIVLVVKVVTKKKSPSKWTES